jgi:hypothetical protein
VIIFSIVVILLVNRHRSASREKGGKRRREEMRLAHRRHFILEAECRENVLIAGLERTTNVVEAAKSEQRRRRRRTCRYPLMMVRALVVFKEESWKGKSLPC